MQGLLRITSGPEEGRCFYVSPSRRVVIGRSQNAELQLTDPQVSRVHCLLMAQTDCVTITDSGSVSGTWVNGERVESRDLQPGDVIGVGATRITFQWSRADERTTTLYDDAPPQS